MTTGAVEKEHVEGLSEEEASSFDGDWEAEIPIFPPRAHPSDLTSSVRPSS